MSALRRQVSATEQEIYTIVQTIDIFRSYIEKYIYMALQANHEEKGIEVVIDVKKSGAYIDLYFPGPLLLSFVCHNTTYDDARQIKPNRIHCKVINKNNYESIGYAGVYLDHPNKDHTYFKFKNNSGFMDEPFKSYIPYFFFIFDAITFCNMYLTPQYHGEYIYPNRVYIDKSYIKTYPDFNLKKINKRIHPNTGLPLDPEDAGFINPSNVYDETQFTMVKNIMPKIRRNVDLIKKIIIHQLKFGRYSRREPKKTKQIENNKIMRSYGDNAVSIDLNRDNSRIFIDLRIDKDITVEVAFDLTARTLISSYVIYKNTDNIGYDKVRLIKVYPHNFDKYEFESLDFGNSTDAIGRYGAYFDIMFTAIAFVLNEDLVNYTNNNGIWNPLPMAGGKKNIKNNLKTNTVLELKSICKNYKIKNYSKLNKDDLISLIKKNKKLLNK